MAKKDNENGTPIEFYIPPASLGGKGPRVPIPINQSNWVYKRNSSSKSSAGILGILIIPIALSILLVSQSMYNSSLWLVVIFFVVLALLQLPYSDNGNGGDKAQSTEENNLNKPGKKAKKIRKQRKDYK